MNENEQYIADSIKTWVWSGFHDQDEIQGMIDDILEGDVDEDMLRSLVKKEIAIKQQEEHTWPKITDCDKIDAVFEALNRGGVVALQEAGYTMSDGFEDVSQVLAELDHNSIISGYCFYHSQDIERAMAGEGLMLAFGDFANTPEGNTKVGKLICSTLKANGLNYDWNENPKIRINITSITWQRRYRA